MAKMNPYLSFDGNCREALEFYRDCFGGDIIFQTIGESPLADQMPVQMKEAILHATLVSSDFELMATDCVQEQGLIRGNAIAICVNCDSEEQIRHIHSKLTAGSIGQRPLKVTFWGALFADLTDKYGNSWMLNFQRE